MNKEDLIHSKHSSSPERVFRDHQKFKDAIWEIYSEALTAAQDQDIILPSRSSGKRGPAIATETDLRENAIRQSADSVLQRKKFSPETENTSNTGMEINTSTRSISPQLSELLDLVVTMETDELEEEMEFSPSETQSTEVEKKNDICKSTINTRNVLNSYKQPNKRLEVSQNYTTTNPLTDEEKEELRIYSKRRRLPGIEQVINKTSFANQRSDYYSRIPAADSKDASNGIDITQQFSDMALLNPQIKQRLPTASTYTPENAHYSYLNSLPGRPTISRQRGGRESFNQSNATESQSSVINPVLSPSVPKRDSWPFTNLSQSTSYLTSPQAQFQNNNAAEKELPGMVELGSPEQSSPSFNNMIKTLNNNQYQKYKTETASNSYGPVADGTVSPQMENIFPPNAMVTRSDLSCPFHPSNRSTLVKGNDYLKNLPIPAYNSLISSSVGSTKPNQTTMTLGNFNTQKPGMGSTTPSPTFSPTEVFSSYGNINHQGVKISPTTPPIQATNTSNFSSGFLQQQNNFLGQPNFQYSTAGSAPARPEFMQHLAGQIGTNTAGVHLPPPNYGAKNQEIITQQGFPARNKSQWSGSYGKPSSLYKNLQGFPAPISSSRVQDYSSPRTRELSTLRGHDLTSPSQQQFTSPYAQQYTSRAQEFPYTFNQGFRSSDIPLASTQEYLSQQRQFRASRPEMHSLQYPQRISAQIPSTSAMDVQMSNLTGLNRFGDQDGTTSKNYSLNTTTRAPRKRRVTKGISMAQTKRIQKKRKQVEEKLFEYISNEHCDQKTSVIITKHLCHVQSCPNWFTGEDCPLCNQICEMLVHSAECQSLNCPFLYCCIKALTTVAENFSIPKFVYGFLKMLDFSEEEMKDVYVIKKFLDQLKC